MKFVKEFEIDEKEVLQCVIDDIIDDYLVEEMGVIIDDYLSDNDLTEDNGEELLYYEVRDKLLEYCGNIIKAKLTLEKPEEESDEPEEPTENVLYVNTGGRMVDVDAKKIADNIDDYFSEYTVNNWDDAEWTEVVDDCLVDIGFTRTEIRYLHSTDQMEDIVTSVRNSYSHLQ